MVVYMCLYINTSYSGPSVNFSALRMFGSRLVTIFRQKVCKSTWWWCHKHFASDDASPIDIFCRHLRVYIYIYIYMCLHILSRCVFTRVSLTLLLLLHMHRFRILLGLRRPCIHMSHVFKDQFPSLAPNGWGYRCSPNVAVHYPAAAPTQSAQVFHLSVFSCALYGVKFSGTGMAVDFTLLLIKRVFSLAAPSTCRRKSEVARLHAFGGGIGFEH